MTNRGADGTGYFVEAPNGGGPGVLVLHSWWGLTTFFTSVCDRLAEAGFTALAPDLLDGALPDTPDEAESILASVDPNTSADLLLRSASTLRLLASNNQAPIGVLGFSMGASWALWLSVRSTAPVAATVSYYGSQNMDMIDSTSAYLGHYADFDSMVTEDEIVELEANLHLVHRPVTFHRYADTSHWFAEEDQPLAYNGDAADLAWSRTLDFLTDHLSPGDSSDADPTTE